MTRLILRSRIVPFAPTAFNRPVNDHPRTASPVANDNPFDGVRPC